MTEQPSAAPDALFPETSSTKAAPDFAALEGHCKRVARALQGYDGDGTVNLVAFRDDVLVAQRRVRVTPPRPTETYNGPTKLEARAPFARRLYDAAVGLSRDHPRANVYLPAAVFRPDIDIAARGGEADIEAVFAVVTDLDDADAPRWAERVPLPPSLVVETSRDRFQCWYFLSPLVEGAEAKALAIALAEHVRCDTVSKSTAQPWRLAGLLNVPTAKKVLKGRPKAPQTACIVRRGALVSPAALRESMAPAEQTGPEAGADGNGHDAELAALLARVPPALLTRIQVPPPPTMDRSAELFAILLALVRLGFTDGEAAALLGAFPTGPAGHCLDKRQGAQELARQIARARAKVEEPPNAATPGAGTGPKATAPAVLDPRDPMPSAREFVRCHHTHGGAGTLHSHRGGFYQWRRSYYVEAGEAEIRAALYRFLEGAVRVANKTVVPYQPNAARVSNVVDALRAVTHLSEQVAAPAWLDGRASPPADELLACRNGLLHLPTRDLLAPTPQHFGLHGVDFAYEKAPAPPAEWLRFLSTLWPSDQEAINALQEMAGYFLTTDTRQQKIFMLVGPKRSGKGTIGRVLKALIGASNVAGPTLSGLGMNFGLAPLIGKPLAIISDARLSGRSDQHLIAERLLSVSGEDVLTIDRKHRDAWTGTLPTRFVLLTNELPRIADASGALASRFLLLTLTTSFYGREDHTLTARLLEELPGVLTWALDGLDRLRKRGHFVQPTSSIHAVRAMEDLGSPVGAFVRDRCVVEPGALVACDALFDEWKSWGEERNREHHGTTQTFARDLHAVVPGLRVTQPRTDPKRARHYNGVRLKTDDEREKADDE